MSYILEALKRSQRERELGKTPTLTASTPEDDVNTTGRNRLLPLALLLAGSSLLVALYAALGGHFSAQRTTLQPVTTPLPETPAQPLPAAPTPTTSPTDSPQIATAEKPPEGTTRRPGIDSADRQLQTPPRPLAAQPATTGPAPEGTPSGRPTAAVLRQELLEVRRLLERQTSDASARRTQPFMAPSAAPEKRAGVTGSDDPVPDRATRKHPVPGPLQALPNVVRQRLPDLRMSVLSYAQDPAQRFVILNSERINEGEIGKDGLKVVAIRPEGAILSFQGHRFFQPL